MFAWRRAALVTGVIVFLALAWYTCNCIWSIQIYNAGPYIGEVRGVLRERDVRIGRFGMWIDVEDLRVALERRLTGLSWVSVSKDGVRLKVYCVVGTPGVAGGGDASPGDIVAARDGIIESVRVAAGTAAVKQGEAVRKGQMLIKGEERTWQNETNAVKARGEVIARVWYTADAIIPANELITVPTGNAAERKVYVTPWLEWSPDSVPAFEKMDVSVRTLPIGAVLPLWARLESYEEVTFEERVRDEASLQAEAALAALRLAREEAGLDKPIVDKWVEYSMMGDGMKAHVTLELTEDIATALD
jgi:similar to stage IV sporulation protein